MFWNATREFRLMLRNDPFEESSGSLAFELCIVGGEEEEDGCPVARVLENEYDGFADDDTFVVYAESLEVEDARRNPHEALQEACERLNAVHNYSVCRCRSYFIKDGAKMCLFCQLTSESPNPPEHMCAICHESSIERHMVKQPCCGQQLHRACLATWAATSKDTRCPLCRRHSVTVPVPCACGTTRV